MCSLEPESAIKEAAKEYSRRAVFDICQKLEANLRGQYRASIYQGQLDMIVTVDALVMLE